MIFRKITLFPLLLLILFTGCDSGSKLEVGDKAPSFEVQSSDGQERVFHSGSDQNTIIYFWADWCSRCDEDFRQVDIFFKKLSTISSSPRLLAVNVGQSHEHVKNVINRLQPTFPIYLDPDGTIARQYSVEELPTYFFVDKNGSIRYILPNWAHLDVLKELCDLHFK